MKIIDQTFADSLRRIRKVVGISLADLSRASRIREERLRVFEAGERLPYANEIVSIADALGVTTDALLRGTMTSKALGVFRNVAARLPHNDETT